MFSKSKLLIVFVGLILGAFLVYRVYVKHFFGVLPESNETVEEIILIDSLSLPKKKIFWVCTDLGTRGFSIGKLAYCARIDDISKENIFFVSSYITNLEYDPQKNELVIYVFGKGSDSRMLKKTDFNIRFDPNGNAKTSLDNRLTKIYKR